MQRARVRAALRELHATMGWRGAMVEKLLLAMRGVA